MSSTRCVHSVSFVSALTVSVVWQAFSNSFRQGIFPFDSRFNELAIPSGRWTIGSRSDASGAEEETGVWTADDAGSGAAADYAWAHAGSAREELRLRLLRSLHTGLALSQALLKRRNLYFCWRGSCRWSRTHRRKAVLSRCSLPALAFFSLATRSPRPSIASPSYALLSPWLQLLRPPKDLASLRTCAAAAVEQ